ncbi:response regulator [Xanthomonas phaseoli]|uniref:response regulator n=1 Tax=Xanthomonas phaseoli TaxID=1985254 RepID=UPI001237AA6A|nr:response regulator [Xanthomonas phaseoli pv. dieffenbachiae]MBO9836807.1 response regulator [Xanthomonas phaseoli pv. dieffenbachiae]MBO9842821.1 response regulator [Xanthomonas phaseoli pv. dieffenbachiae]MBO9863448.1 response regulator [Xanthomonas phaseoli pv. dieffenbachiae]MBO9867571.1 response regulator [Xanthomonas phaseoli pv. dieffenbachiae]
MWVLVVDDSPSSIIFINEALRSLGHSVLTRTNGSSALETLQAMEVDAALVDYHMPGMNAAAFIETLRKQTKSATAATPVVVMTADASPKVATTALSMGAAAVVHKPLGLNELAAAIDAIDLKSQR